VLLLIVSLTWLALWVSSNSSWSVCERITTMVITPMTSEVTRPAPSMRRVPIRVRI